MIIKLNQSCIGVNKVDNLDDYPDIQTLMMFIENTNIDCRDFTLIGTVDNLGKLFPEYLNKVKEPELKQQEFYNVVKFEINNRVIRFIGMKNPYSLSEENVYLFPEEDI